MDLLLKHPTRQRVFAFIFSCVCFAGAFYQVSVLAVSYFQYNTTSLLEILPGTSYKPQTLNVCVRFTDLLNYTGLRESNASRSKWQKSTDTQVVRDMQKSLLISEIFDYTPEPRETIRSARFRRADSFEQHTCNSTECYNLFYTSKFVYLEYICYYFRPLVNQTMSYHSISVTPSSPGEIFSIKLNSIFKGIVVYRICYDELYSYPYEALPNAPAKKRFVHVNEYHREDVKKQDNITQLFNSIITSFNQLQTDLLPKPYDTRCEFYYRRSFISRAHCIQTCMNTSVYEGLHKIPFSVIVNRSIDAYLISYHDLSDNHVTKQLFTSENECRDQCSRPDCRSILTFTQAHEEAGVEPEIFLILSSSPFTKITALKQIEFVEFLASAMSSVSTWTGIAIISFNPVAFYFILKRYTERLKSHRHKSAVQKNQIQVDSGKYFLPGKSNKHVPLEKPFYLGNNYTSQGKSEEIGRLMAKNRILHQVYRTHSEY